MKRYTHKMFDIRNTLIGLCVEALYFLDIDQNVSVALSK